MKAGFYKTDLSVVEGFYDPLDPDAVEDAATDFADENHQIDEASDMSFTVYVEDDGGDLHKVTMFTEYDPRFEVESVSKLSEE